VQVQIVGRVETFPTLDPTVPFLIVDDATLELSRLVANGQPTPASEWWFRVDAGTEASVLQTLRSSPYSAASVIGQQELTGELSSDPVALGVLGVLGLGSLAAMSFAAIAFLVSGTVSTSERVGEFAILRALGLSARQLAAWLAAESAFLLTFGLLAGSATGILLGWLVLPFASFTQDGSAAVPAPVVIIPWTAILPLYGLTAVLFVASVLVVRRQLPTVRITDVLRGPEEAA
jgi:ABC-type antimicrobial peptide transport system permease subunit